MDMIDFKEEINKYKPIRPVEEVEETIKNDILDKMDLLHYISGKTNKPTGAGGEKIEMP